MSISTFFNTDSEADLYPTHELVQSIQHERRRAAEANRLANLAACLRACCSASVLDRLARTLRLVPTNC